MQDFKSRSPRRAACVAFIACCAACNALLDNHSRDLKVVAPGAGGTAMAAAGVGGASGDSNGSSESGAAGRESEPAGGRAGAATGGTAGMSQGGTSQGGTSHGGMPACSGCTPGATEAQTRDGGICN